MGTHRRLEESYLLQRSEHQMHSSTTVIAIAVAITAACSPPAGRDRGGRRTTFGGAQDGPRGVVVFPAYLHPSPGSGDSFGTLSPGVVVIRGEERGEWQEVAVEGPIAVSGWIRSERIGCRALREVALEPLDDEDSVEVTVRPGAVLAVLRRESDSLQVETRDAIVRRGRLQADACGVGERFVPTLPRDGILFVVGRETRILSTTGGGESIATLPEGYRFVALSPARSGYAVGRTDGPVVVRGRVDATALEEDPRSTPLDRLALPLGYTHETIIDAPLLDGVSGSEILPLRGGTPLNVVERRDDWARVETVGRVELNGWLPLSEIRRVALDHNELDPSARRRQHSPVDRSRPRSIEGDEP